MSLAFSRVPNLSRSQPSVLLFVVIDLHAGLVEPPASASSISAECRGLSLDIHIGYQRAESVQALEIESDGYGFTHCVEEGGFGCIVEDSARQRESVFGTLHGLGEQPSYGAAQRCHALKVISQV